MATVYRKSYTKPLPEGAELLNRKGEQFARWRKGGKLKTAPVIVGKGGELRVRIEAETYTAKYRDGQGIVRETATGCRDKTAAQAVLRELTARAERVKSGILSTDDNAVIDHQHTQFAEHVAAYLESHRNRGSSPNTIEGIEIRLRRLQRDCQLTRLSDLTADSIHNWLTVARDAKMAPRTRNSYLEVAKAFANWCVKTKRLLANPLADIAKAEQSTDRRLVRRSLTPTELERLLYAARWRPLADLGRESTRYITPKGRATWKLTPLSFDALPDAIERARAKLANKPERVAELERLGRERALAYKSLVLTGLRRGELASLTVGSLVLDAPMPYAILEAGDAKNRQRAEIPLRSDLAADLATWIAELREAFAGRSGATGAVLSIDAARAAQLPSDARLFPSITKQFVKVLDRDLAAASIGKRDDRGRTVDIHALRHTYGSLLSAGGVAPRTAQAAMRHSSIDLTMNVYTDPQVLDIAGALDALPTLSLDSNPQERQRNVATGTMGRTTEQASENPLAPMLAPNSDNRCKSVAIGDNWASLDDSPCASKNPKKQSVSRDFSKHARQDSNLQPLVPKTSALSN